MIIVMEAYYYVHAKGDSGSGVVNVGRSRYFRLKCDMLAMHIPFTETITVTFDKKECRIINRSLSYNVRNEPLRRLFFLCVSEQHNNLGCFPPAGGRKRGEILTTIGDTLETDFLVFFLNQD